MKNLPVEIRTEHLPNISLESYTCSKALDDCLINRVPFHNSIKPLSDWGWRRLTVDMESSCECNT
jgi:hypothetical protein